MPGLRGLSSMTDQHSEKKQGHDVLAYCTRIILEGQSNEQENISFFHETIRCQTLWKISMPVASYWCPKHFSQCSEKVE